MSRPIAAEEKASFFKNGYLIIRDALTTSETQQLQQWAQEVHKWPVSESSPWMPYEEVNASGKRVLCRTENYANSHPGFNSLLRGDRLLNILGDLAEEPMILFKEKINYKLAGSGGFAPHVDSTAYTHVKKIKHLTILLAVDASNLTNGGLEVVNGSHNMDVPIAEDNCIEPDWVAKQIWTPVELEAGESIMFGDIGVLGLCTRIGQLLVFGSYLAHRSGANTSSSDRKAIYGKQSCNTVRSILLTCEEQRLTIAPERVIFMTLTMPIVKSCGLLRTCGKRVRSTKKAPCDTVSVARCRALKLGDRLRFRVTTHVPAFSVSQCIAWSFATLHSAYNATYTCTENPIRRTPSLKISQPKTLMPLQSPSLGSCSPDCYTAHHGTRSCRRPS